MAQRLPQRDVIIVVGSKSDIEPIEQAKVTTTLRGLKVSCEIAVASAHRNPDELAEYVADFRRRRVKAVIAVAGLSAALPGAVSAHSVKDANVPVFGVALTAGSFGAMDAVFSMISMPPNVPVAIVGADAPGLKNAALLAAQTVAISKPRVRERLQQYLAEQSSKKPPMIPYTTQGGA